MVGSGSRKVVRAMLRMIRDLVLMLAVGALGAQLLIALNGGEPIGTEVRAFADLPAQPDARVASVELDLDPLHPAQVRAVHVELVGASDSAPRHLRLSPAPGSRARYDCHRETPTTWHCPTPGLMVGELEQIVIES